jgi:hypothetical protein
MEVDVLFTYVYVVCVSQLLTDRYSVMTKVSS